MSRRMAVSVQNLTQAQEDAIRAAAERHGFEIRFLPDPAEDREYLNSSEVVFGHLPGTARHSTALKWICTPYAGVDQFLAPGGFANPEAMLSNSSGAYGVTIAEHTVMILLEILRRRKEYRRITDGKGWIRDLPVRAIKGAKILMAGTGDIGQETAIRLRAFGPAKITGVNRNGKNPGGLFDRICTAKDWEAELTDTEILIVSLPGTKESFHMIGEKQLAALPEGAVIINVGRGSVIDQAALTRELANGRLYAGLDVFEQEPPAEDDPVWELENLVMTPHTAGNMTLPYTVQRIVELFLEDLENYCAGRKPARLVDREAGY